VYIAPLVSQGGQRSIIACVVGLAMEATEVPQMSGWTIDDNQAGNVRRVSRRATLSSAAGFAIAGAIPLARANQPTAAPRRGGTATAVITPEPVTLNAGLNTAMPTAVLWANIFDGLVRYGFDLKPHPELAESWEVAEDGLSITFHLRQGVTWHDGTPFTAADVQWTLDNVWKTVHPRNRLLFAAVERVDTPDPHTAIFRLSTPSIAIMGALNSNGAPILPRHLFAGTDLFSNPHNNAPIGTGPFVFKEWSRGNHILLERNPHYWDNGKPYLDQVIWRFIPDGSARSIAFETGEAQFAPYSPVALQDVDRLAKLPSLTIEKRGYEWTGAWLYLELNLDNKYLRDIRVRHAIAHAIDRKGVADVVWFGFAKPAISPIPSTATTFFDPTVPRYPYDLKRAEALLDEAGLPRGPNGTRFAVTHDPVPYGDDFHRTGEYVKQSLKRVGIDVTLRTQDTAVFTKRVYGDRDFDISSSWTALFSDPQIGYGKIYTSSIIGKNVPWTNASGYRNPEVDAIFAEAQREPDPQKRVALFNRFQHIVQTDLPILPLIELNFFSVVASNLRDAVTASDPSLRDAWLAA
jgi:peptide/nickel transport system substrate-binding protein